MDVLFVQLQIDVDEGPQGRCRACIAQDRIEKCSQKSSSSIHKQSQMPQDARPSGKGKGQKHCGNFDFECTGKFGN